MLQQVINEIPLGTLEERRDCSVTIHPYPSSNNFNLLASSKITSASSFLENYQKRNINKGNKRIKDTNVA